ncbi:MAG: fibronectin type III domain-containing protein [Sandaracinaceae bacterium]|nr:fibronectin type III domain-containing protein [Sandaracinaceae bacterium]
MSRRTGRAIASTAALALLALGAPGCLLDRSGTGPIDAGLRRDAGLDAGDVGDDAGAHDGGAPLEVPGPLVAPTFADIGEDTVRVEWRAPVGGGAVATYSVERAPDDGERPGTFEEIAAALTATSFTDAPLAAGTTYWYRVRASNAAGAGPYSPPAGLTTPRPPLGRIVQSAFVEGTDPTASFPATPAEGSLLLAVGFHRLDHAAPQIDGWDHRLEHFFRTSEMNRRGITVWARIAQAGEPRDVRLQWSPGRQCSLLIVEIGVPAGATATFLASVGRSSDDERVTSLDTALGPLDAREALLVGVFGARDGTSTEVAFDGLDEAITAPLPTEQADAARALALATGRVEGAVTPSTVVSWAPPRRATIGLLAFRVE